MCSAVARTPRLRRCGSTRWCAAAAVAEAGNMSDEDLVRAERVSVGASAGWFGPPLAVDGPDELPVTHPRIVKPTNDSSARHSSRVAGRVVLGRRVGC